MLRFTAPKMLSVAARSTLFLFALRGKPAPASSWTVKQRHHSFGILDECGMGAGSRPKFLARGRDWHGRPGDGPTDVTQLGMPGPTETGPSRSWPGGRVLLVTPHSAGPPRNCERAFGGNAMVPFPRPLAISMPWPRLRKGGVQQQRASCNHDTIPSGDRSNLDGCRQTRAHRHGFC